jgi:hypothetical protein
MQKMKWILMLVLGLSSANIVVQVGQQRVDARGTASLDADREKHAVQVLAKLTEKVIVSAADAMPADNERQLWVQLIATACTPTNEMFRELESGAGADARTIKGL